MEQTRYGLRVPVSLPYDEEPEVGLLLPCNVVVYETRPASSVIAAMAPLVALGLVEDNADLAEVALEADARLWKALSSLESVSSDIIRVS